MSSVAPPRRALGALLSLLLAASAGAVSVDFDDRAGKPGPFNGECGASFELDDEYLALGVRFASNDPAVCVLQAGNAPSPPNVVTGSTEGEVDFSAPVVASFFDGATPAAVSLVKLTLTNGSAASVTVAAYDESGALLGTSGQSGAGRYTLSFPRRIHSVRVAGGAFGMDDLEFSQPGPSAEVPALPWLARAGVAALLAGVGLLALRR